MAKKIYEEDGGDGDIEGGDKEPDSDDPDSIVDDDTWE